jgi:hypothetical protein
VRIGVAEVQRRDAGVARLDGDLFDAKADEHRPDDIGELRREDEDRQRHARSGALGCHPDRNVAEEHIAAIR